MQSHDTTLIGTWVPQDMAGTAEPALLLQLNADNTAVLRSHGRESKATWLVSDVEKTLLFKNGRALVLDEGSGVSLQFGIAPGKLIYADTRAVLVKQ
jgi:hypothetical protein